MRWTSGNAFGWAVELGAATVVVVEQLHQHSGHQNYVHYFATAYQAVLQQRRTISICAASTIRLFSEDVTAKELVYFVYLIVVQLIYENLI